LIRVKGVGKTSRKGEKGLRKGERKEISTKKGGPPQQWKQELEGKNHSKKNLQ